MKLTIDELKTKLVDYIGDDTSDKAIELLEDFTDSTSEYETSDEWELRYNQLDADWRKKYIERFSEKSVIDEDKEELKTYNYDDLFKERKDD